MSHFIVTAPNSTRVLFTGYAPVHFLCFRPLYERMIADPGFDVFVSGGLRTKDEHGVHYDARGLYEPFGVPAERVLTVEEIRARDFDLLFGANTKPIGPRRATTKIQIFHGISFRNVAIREEVLAWDYFFLTGPYMRRRFVETGLLQPEDLRALDIGFPKTDRLRNGARSRAEMLAPHGFDGTRPVVLYAPTGQKHNSLETMGEEVIRRLGATEAWDVLIKLHDHPKETINWPARLAALEGPRVRVARSTDVIPLLGAADLLITDASSVSSEYSLLDRPMVFLDVPKLIGKAQLKNTSLDLQTWGRRGGVLVEKPEDVVGAVEASLRAPENFSEVRRAMAADLFYHPGGATDAAMRAVRRIVAGANFIAERGG